MFEKILCFKIQSSFYDTFKEAKEVFHSCGHSEPIGNPQYKYCPECGTLTSKIVIFTETKFKEGFSIDETDGSYLYKNKFKVQKDDSNRPQFYIFIPYNDTDIQSIKAAVQELEMIEQEMKQLNIKGIAGLIAPYWD